MSPLASCGITIFISYYPLKQGLKLYLRPSRFIYRNVFISYYPLKQGLKQSKKNYTESYYKKIYILLSIKTRIETVSSAASWADFDVFISYYPLKQGLKPPVPGHRAYARHWFISYYPLKQGLKQLDPLYNRIHHEVFISYYPLKQGLKPRSGLCCVETSIIYILLSIKTRIETACEIRT